MVRTGGSRGCLLRSARKSQNQTLLFLVIWGTFTRIKGSLSGIFCLCGGVGTFYHGVDALPSITPFGDSRQLSSIMLRFVAVFFPLALLGLTGGDRDLSFVLSSVITRALSSALSGDATWDSGLPVFARANCIARFSTTSSSGGKKGESGLFLLEQIPNTGPTGRGRFLAFF